MGEDRLGELLRGLPAERAPEDFAGRVLARLDAGPAARPARPRRRLGLGLLAAGALAAAACGLLLLRWNGPEEHHRSALRQELASLQREARALERALTPPEAGQAPLVYLGSDERADYVLDLRQVEAPGGVLPVLLSNHGQGGVL
jgi:hypothetical protein